KRHPAPAGRNVCSPGRDRRSKPRDQAVKLTARHRKSQIGVRLELARNAGTLISVSVRAKDQLHLHLPLNFGATQRQRSKNKKGDQRRLFLVAGARLELATFGL